MHLHLNTATHIHNLSNIYKQAYIHVHSIYNACFYPLILLTCQFYPFPLIVILIVNSITIYMFICRNNNPLLNDHVYVKIVTN